MSTTDNKNNQILVNTPLGTLKAVEMPDNDNPGICIQHIDNNDVEQASCVFEFNAMQNRLHLLVWDHEHADDDPLTTIIMSEII